MKNLEKVKECIDEIKDRAEQEKDILQLYLVAEGDVMYVDNDSAEPLVELSTLYQFIVNEMEEIENNNYGLHFFSTCLDTMFHGYVSIYRYNGNALKKLFPNYSYDESGMGTVLGINYNKEDNVRNVSHNIIEDNYLKTFMDFICNMYNKLDYLYCDAKDQRTEASVIRMNINSAINKVMDEVTNEDDYTGLINFYDFIYKQIQEYKTKEEK